MADIDAELLQTGGTAGDNDETDYAERLNREQATARRNSAATANIARASQAAEEQRETDLSQRRLAAQAAMSQGPQAGPAGPQGNESQSEGSESESGSEQDEESQAQALRQQQQEAATKKGGGDISGKVAGQLSSKFNKAQAVSKALKGGKEAFKDMTASILKFAWEIMMETFGLAIFIVDLILFLGLVFGNESVCKLGHEWTPKELKQMKPKEAEAAGDRLAMAEKAGCCCITSCWGLIIFIILCIIAAVMKFIENPVGTIFGALWDMITAWWNSVFG